MQKLNIYITFCVKLKTVGNFTYIHYAYSEECINLRKKIFDYYAFK